MAKFNNTHGITKGEWDNLPVVVHVPTIARLIGSNERYVTNHAAEFGGQKVGGKWCFSKSKVSKLLEIA